MLIISRVIKCQKLYDTYFGWSECMFVNALYVQQDTNWMAPPPTLHAPEATLWVGVFYGISPQFTIEDELQSFDKIPSHKY